MAGNVYEELLRLTGFEENEMSQCVPDFRKACDLLKIAEDDVQYALEKQIPAYYDIELMGVRKLLGCWMRELIDLSKANEYKQRGVKIVYGILPAISLYYYALKAAAPDRIYVSFPDMFLAYVLNRPFHRKLFTFLEEAERYGMSYGCRHCALNKTRFAVRRLGIIPSADVSWIWGYVCDEGPKSDEYINLVCDPNWKTFVTRICHDQPLFAVEDEDVERVKYLAAQMQDSFEAVQKEVGVKVTDEAMKTAISRYQRYMRKLGEFNKLMGADPQPTLFTTGHIATSVMGAPYNIGLEYAQEALDITVRELEQRISNGKGVLPKGAPKLLFRSTPGGIPGVLKLFQDNGIAMYGGMTSKKQALPPSFEDPYMAAAQIWLRVGGSTNLGYEAEQLIEKMETYHADAMMFGFLDFDRWLGASQKLMSRIVRERTNKPVFYIEGDIWEDRDYTLEGLRTRVESVVSIMKARKG